MPGSPAIASRARVALRLAGLLALVACAWLPARDAGAQDGGLSLQVVAVTAADWPHPQAVVTAVDADGRPLTGLSPEQFQATLNGSPVPVETATVAVDSSIPVAVVLALDASGSMEGAPIEQAKAAAQRFLAGLAPEDSVTVLTFHTIVAVVQPFTSDAGLAARAIESLQAGGSTALYEATAESVRLAADAATSRRAVVLLSDGLDHGSALSRDDSIAPARTLGVPVFTIGLGEDIDRAYLQELADVSGGRFAETPSPDGLADLYQDVSELLRGQYVLTIDASALDLPESEPATLSLQLALDGETGSDSAAVCPQRLCIALRGVEADERLQEQRTVLAEVVSEEPVTRVTFLVDGEPALEADEPPYQYTFDPGLFVDGAHTLSAQVHTAAGDASTGELTVRVGAPAGGSNSMLMLLGVAVLVIGGGVLALVILRRRRRGGRQERFEDVRPAGPTPPPVGGAKRRPLWDESERAPVEQIGAVLGHLKVTNGPAQGEVYPVGGAPISIGAGHRCLIRLEVPAEFTDEIASEHARVWVREGHLMVHEIRRLTETGGVGGRWAILEPGEAFSIGPFAFQFHLGPGDPEPPAPSEPHEVPNILRDGPAQPKDPAAAPTSSGTEGSPTAL